MCGEYDTGVSLIQLLIHTRYEILILQQLFSVILGGKALSAKYCCVIDW